MENKIIENYNRSIFYYGLSLLIPWILWFAAAYISHLPEKNSLLNFSQGALSILGLLTPVFVAAYLFLSNRELFTDLKLRFFRMKGRLGRFASNKEFVSCSAQLWFANRQFNLSTVWQYLHERI